MHQINFFSLLQLWELGGPTNAIQSHAVSVEFPCDVTLARDNGCDRGSRFWCAQPMPRLIFPVGRALMPKHVQMSLIVVKCPHVHRARCAMSCVQVEHEISTPDVKEEEWRPAMIRKAPRAHAHRLSYLPSLSCTPSLPSWPLDQQCANQGHCKYQTTFTRAIFLKDAASS